MKKAEGYYSSQDYLCYQTAEGEWVQFNPESISPCGEYFIYEVWVNREDCYEYEDETS